MEPVEPEDETRDSAREDARGGDDLPNADDLIGTFMQEASLWPVLIVVLGSGGAFGAALIILAAVDHNPFAAAALVLVVGMSIDITVRAWRNRVMRNLAKLILALWISAAGFAALAVWTGIAFGS